jgi:diaminohydroxyphosphoribosylaminopyrimidine deaminase / 5-amino-6-(5-phosphoribosylamino)uracil reductase
VSDERWMGRAIALAEHARGSTHPNPAVGCVVVADGRVVGEGWTSPPGGPHAEVVALRAAAGQARGATVYTTLEPCDHHGRTGPCSEALVAAGVSRVVIAAPDHSPGANGGADRLRAAGVDVAEGVCEQAAREQNAAFFRSLAAGRPVVTVKLAVSLDGRVAAADGTSRWLTGEAARRAVHHLRARSDAVLVGSGTALADDPQLTVRLEDPCPQPLRVVLDGRARTRPELRVFGQDAPSVVVVGDAADATALESAGVEVWRVGGDRATGEPLRSTLERLGERGVRSVLVEGGSQIASAFVAAGLADLLIVHVAPLLLGAEGLPAVDLAVPTLDAAPRWRLERTEQVGGDAVLYCTPEEA